MTKRRKAARDARPAFEVIMDGQAFRIFESGRVDGFPEGQKVIINRIPTLMNEHACNVLESAKDAFNAA